MNEPQAPEAPAIEFGMGLPPEPGNPSAVEAPMAGNGPEVLVVEDGELQALVLQRFLVDQGFRVTVAGSASDARRCLEQGAVRLVIADCDLPAAAGYELCRAIKTDARWAGLPVILLTSTPTVEGVLEGLECQADYYLSKPYQPDFLLDRARKLLAGGASAEAAADQPQPIEVEIDGRRKVVRAGRRAMLRLLLSTYECTVQQNRQLVRTQRALGERNGQLQAKTQRLEASEQSFRNLLESSSDGMVVINPAGEVQYGNAAARSLLCQPGEELVGRPFGHAVSVDQATEARLQRPEEAEVIADVRAADTLWQGQPALLVSLRDVTQRKRDELRIREQQVKLEELNVQLHALATLDALTGLRNRRMFQERLPEEVQRAGRYRHALSLLMLDVDRFKAYNDNFGHMAGDDVLRTVARLIEASIRHTDFAARYGGEEFAVLLPYANPRDAVVVAERIRRAIETARWPHRPVTASLGVASVAPEVQTAPVLMAGADRALYHSKATGRNRVTAAADLPPD